MLLRDLATSTRATSSAHGLFIYGRAGSELSRDPWAMKKL